MEHDIDFAMPLKNKYKPDKTCHRAWTGSSGDLLFFHSMTYRQVHSGNIKLKMKHQLRQSVHFTFHSWNTISCFFRERVETEAILFVMLWNIYLCPLKLFFPLYRWKIQCSSSLVWHMLRNMVENGPVFWVINAVVFIISSHAINLLHQICTQISRISQ